MKLEIKSNFSFSKLASNLPKILNKQTRRMTRSSAQGAKENIDKGLSPPLSKYTTLPIRKMRGTGGSKPLYETGALYRSIKSTKDGVQMLKYGIYHQEGYKVKKNSFTDFYYIKTKKEGEATQLAGKSVPARPFIFPSQKTILKSIDAFKKDLRKGMRR